MWVERSLEDAAREASTASPSARVRSRQVCWAGVLASESHAGKGVDGSGCLTVTTFPGSPASGRLSSDDGPVRRRREADLPTAPRLSTMEPSGRCSRRHHLQVHRGLRGSILEAAPGGAPDQAVRLWLEFGPEGTTWDAVARTHCSCSPTTSASSSSPASPSTRCAATIPGGPSLASRPARRGSALLLDQQVIDGVGNRPRGRTLHRCGIPPARSGAA